ncbi:MAG: DUF3276 family protein, partial [Tidjanibacter sp.]|nr:DUF3276 family protein [Tidjanibacter sp.]
MDESEHSIFTLNAETNEYSLPVRAGRRTYFFYVKRTRDADPFVVITESRRVGTDSEGKSSYEKSRLHLYKEDFEKFSAALAEVTDHVAALPEPRQQTDKQHVSTP